MSPGSLRALVAGAVVAWATSGCSTLAFNEGFGASPNRCETDADCGDAGRCLTVDDTTRSCVGRVAQLEQVWLEVRPTLQTGPSEPPFYLEPLGDLFAGESASGFVVHRDIDLPRTLRVSPQVTSTDDAPPCAVAPDGTFEARITLTPVVSARGLPADPFEAKSTGSLDTGFDLAIDVPPGTYEVYLQPVELDDDTCAFSFPPYYAGSTEVVDQAPPTINLPAPSVLAGTIVPGQGQPEQDLEGWTVTLVEPSQGRRISGRIPVVANDGGGVRFEGLRYYPIGAQSPILRLDPPADPEVPRPSAYWALSGLDVAGTGQVSLTLADLLISPKHYGGTVVERGGQARVPASVTFESRTLSGGVAGQAVTYRTRVDTDASGDFEVDLLVGTYRVIVTPSGDVDHALTVAEWIVSESDLPSRTLEVDRKRRLEGGIVLPDAAQPFGFAIRAAPTPAPVVPFLDAQVGLSAVVPSLASALPADDGSFAFDVDPGTFDVSVTNDDGGYPWLIVPAVSVDEGDVSVGLLEVPFPVYLTGTIRRAIADDEVSFYAPLQGGALVRAWLARDGVAIPIGETDVSRDGTFRLPLPPGLE